MKRVLGIFLLLAFSFSLGWARLGESEYQCVTRYGDVQKKSLRSIKGVEYPALYFYKSGYGVAVIFSNEKAAVIVFLKPDQTEMDDAEISMLLSTEGEKFKWTESTPTQVQRSWTRVDGAVAVYRNGDHSLTIASKDFAEVALHPPATSNDGATKGL